MSNEIKFRMWAEDRMQQVHTMHSVHYNFGYRDDEMLMQFTGLKDKNGKEIYEGDILMIRADVLGVIGKAGHKVVFGNYSIGEDDYGLKHQTPCFCIEFKDGSGHCRIDEEVIVIGNIYENPELITNV